MYEQVLAGTQGRLGAEGVVSGGEDLGEAPGLRPLERLRNRHGGALVDQGELGLRAPAHHRHHSLPHLEAVGTGTEGHHLARQLHAGDVRRGARRRWVGPPALEHVGAVQAGRPHPNEQLALSGFGIRTLLHDEIPVLDGYSAHKRGGYPRVLLMRCNTGTVPSNR